jgi:hypothetical protein
MKRWLVWRGIALVWVLGVLGTGATIAGCSDGDDDDPAPAEVRGDWERGAVWAHGDVYFSFDRVAVGSTPGTVSWVTRRASGATTELAYWELGAETGTDAASTELPVRPGGPAVLIPVGVATDGEGWVALAATRDTPRGDNTGLLAWQARRTPGQEAAVTPGVRLAPPAGVTGVPQQASVGRSDGTTMVVALYGGEVVLWSLPEATANGPAGPATSWEARQPDLGLEGDDELVNLHITGDGERFVLAGVDNQARAHVWTSTDGDDWEPLSGDAGDPLPTEVGAVGLLAPLGDGEVALGWLADEDSAPANASSATIQRLAGDELRDQGVITGAATSDADRIDLGGATLSPAERLVVVGAALQPSGDRTPMVWAREAGDWTASEQPELIARLDYELRTVTATDDDRLVGLVTGITHVDVETWRWQPPDN